MEEQHKNTHPSLPQLTMRPCSSAPLLLLLLALAATETTHGFAPPHQYAAPQRIITELYSSVSETSQMVQGIRSQLAENEEAALVMDALRGKNMNDDDAQAAGVQMRLVDASGSETLKTDYDPKALREFFSKRPLTVINRIAQVAGVGGGWVLRNVMDKVLGRSSPDLEVQRAGELRDVITSLGPFYIKIGQALSIRPDVLSPRSMVELQKLCDKVPSFDSKIAFGTIERELGKSVDEIFSEITPEPVAAVSFPPLGLFYQKHLILSSLNKPLIFFICRLLFLQKGLAWASLQGHVEGDWRNCCCQGSAPRCAGNGQPRSLPGQGGRPHCSEFSIPY